MTHFSLRQARLTDIGPLDDLFQRSYAQLLAPDYSPSVLALAVPIMGRAQPELIRSGRFHVVTEDDRLLGAAGWSFETPGSGKVFPDIGHIRHVATDPAATRRGVGRMLMSHILEEMAGSDLDAALCQSTLSAKPFYMSMGFAVLRHTTVVMGGTLPFQTVLMRCEL